MSKIVDSLEDDGFVTRVPDPLDGRASMIQLSAVGRDMIHTIRVANTEALEVALDDAQRGRTSVVARVTSRVGKGRRFLAIARGRLEAPLTHALTVHPGSKVNHNERCRTSPTVSMRRRNVHQRVIGDQRNREVHAHQDEHSFRGLALMPYIDVGREQDDRDHDQPCERTTSAVVTISAPRWANHARNDDANDRQLGVIREVEVPIAFGPVSAAAGTTTTMTQQPQCLFRGRRSWRPTRRPRRAPARASRRSESASACSAPRPATVR